MCVKCRVADTILLTLVNMLNLNQTLAKDGNQKHVFLLSIGYTLWNGDTQGKVLSTDCKASLLYFCGSLRWFKKEG